MSLVPCITNATPDSTLFVAAAPGSTPAAPIIAGNPVQLCTGGPTASASGVANATNSITSAGTDTATAVLRLGTAAQPNALVLGPQNAVPNIANGTLTARIAMAANAQISCSTNSQFLCQNGGQVFLESGAEIDVQSGATVKFNNAGAQSGTFRATVVVGNIADTATAAVANPPSIVAGVYAVMASCDPPTASANVRQISTVAVYDGALWSFGGSVSAPNNLELQPAAGLATLQIVNGTGGLLTGVEVRFVLLAAGA